MVYVAFLRGINVGGNNKVPMPRLAQVFEACGCTHVKTYINSGNVIFEDDRLEGDVTPLLEAAIAKEFTLNIPIVLRTKVNIQKLVTEIPDDWTNDQAQKTDVMFLWQNIDSADILDNVEINQDIETARYIDGALVWNIGRENVTRGGGIKVAKSDLYKSMTVRNINTVRKLHELMS